LNATILRIADSVTVQLNARAFSQTFKAERLYVPNFDLEDMKDLRVTIVPREIDLLPLDRTSNRVHGVIDIAVQKKFKRGDAEEIDPLVAFVEEIADEFRIQRLVSYVAARCIKVETSVLYSVEHWEQLRQFTSLLTLTFELAR
jgi:hypothetical protein